MHTINALGRHILVEYYNCNNEILKDPKLIETYMKESAIKMGATIVESCFHHFNPYGVSGAVIISESHLTIHTWPEYGYAAVDLFTCGTIDPWVGFNYLEKKLLADISESTEIPRGLTQKIAKHGNFNADTIFHKPNA